MNFHSLCNTLFGNFFVGRPLYSVFIFCENKYGIYIFLSLNRYVILRFHDWYEEAYANGEKEAFQSSPHKL
jgi:hypothetical protein